MKRLTLKNVNLFKKFVEKCNFLIYNTFEIHRKSKTINIVSKGEWI